MKNVIIVALLFVFSCKSSDSGSQTLNSDTQNIDEGLLNGLWWLVDEQGEKMTLSKDNESLPPSRFRQQWFFDVAAGNCWKTVPGPDDRPRKLEGTFAMCQTNNLIVGLENTLDTMRIITLTEYQLTLEK